MTPNHEAILSEFKRLASTIPTGKSLMQRMAERLHEEMAHYNWVGFYLVDPTNSRFLIVGPFVGSFTPNQRIPLDKGLCGAAARHGETIVVNDVSKDSRYLSGSSMVKSEIVVPIFAQKALAAELDIESYFADTFTPAEQQFVEACARLVETHSGI
jgi:L-methionine (R)-S-oxide reductase